MKMVCMFQFLKIFSRYDVVSLNLCLNVLDVHVPCCFNASQYRYVFTNQSNIYNGAFLQKQLTTSQKASIIDIQLGSKYASAVFCSMSSEGTYCSNGGMKLVKYWYETVTDSNG